MAAFVPADEFLDRHESLGPSEAPRAGSEFTSHEAADFDIKFLLSLAREGHELFHIMCIPDHYLCVYHDPDYRVTFHHRRCPSHDGSADLRIPGGILATDIDAQTPVLHTPPRFAEEVDQCDGRFVVSNFGLYSRFGDGHANALIFDKELRTIERFEPAGKHRGHARLDSTLARLFGKVLPGWKFVGTEHSAPARGPQAIADAFDGLCVTYSLLYTLLRLLNPDRSPKELSRHMVAGRSRAQIRNEALRLNRHVVKRLRASPRGSLVRRKVPSMESFSASFARDRAKRLHVFMNRFHTPLREISGNQALTSPHRRRRSPSPRPSYPGRPWP